MGIRSRLKAIVVKRLGGDPSGSVEAPPPTPPAPPAPPAPTPPAASSPAPKLAPAAAPAPPPSTKPTVDPEMAAKVAKHFEKTRKAVLQFVIDEGGVASMADMHDYSERRYFIAHRKFSDLMEGIVGEGLVAYDESAGEASITDAGQAYLAD